MTDLKFKVISDSMTPLIQINSELVFISTHAELKAFDIILFKRNQQLIVHYVWRNQINYNSTVITRSLKNIYYDEPPILDSEIIGLVTNFKISFSLKLKILLLNIIKGRS